MVLAGLGDEVFITSDWPSGCISVSTRVNNAMRKVIYSRTMFSNAVTLFKRLIYRYLFRLIEDFYGVFTDLEATKLNKFRRTY